MSKNSNIEWTDHTFNPWSGCKKVSPACAHCYAEALAKRVSTLGGWGPGAPRRRTTADYWKAPLKWNRDAARTGIRPRVFSASLADWLDDEVPIEWLRDLLILIQQTPNLDWLLLTKRPENFATRIAAVAEGWQSSCELAVWWTRGIEPPNVWIGVTTEDQARVDERIPLLRRIPAKVRFLSCEPLLGPIELFNSATTSLAANAGDTRNYSQPWLDWVICGGESGPKARPMHPDWARFLRDQCAYTSVPFFFKQWGEWAPGSNFPDFIPSGRAHHFGDESLDDNAKVWHVGKKAAGRLLDGVLHDGFPAVKGGAL